MTNRQSTHGSGCWGWGQRHYECAVREIERLAAQLTAAQQPAAPSEEAGGFDANFLRHIASVCRAAYDLCQPKPQRTPEDPREYHGELCLSELANIADEIARRLAAPSGNALADEFAAEIEALRSERDALREALKDIRQVLEVLGRAHHVAMEQTLKARIPECGEFAGIAQDLDFVVATLRERLGEGAEP